MGRCRKLRRFDLEPFDGDSVEPCVGQPSKRLLGSAQEQRKGITIGAFVEMTLHTLGRLDRQLTVDMGV